MVTLGCRWDPFAAGLYLTETQDKIRKWWEECKVELTRQWKGQMRELEK